MSVAALDTLKFATTLREHAKVTPEQAEGFADAINEALRNGAAPRTDLRELELRLEAKIEASKAEIIKWMLGVIGSQTLIIFGAVVSLARVI